jgi:hypothetical protein
MFILAYFPFLRGRNKYTEVVIVYVFSVSTFDPADRFLREWYEHYNITAQAEASFSVTAIWQTREIVKWEENIFGYVQEDSKQSPLLEYGENLTASFYVFRKNQTLHCKRVTYRRSRLLRLLASVMEE